MRTPSEIRSAAETAEKEAALKDRIASQPTKENYLILAQYAALRHIGQGSQLVYKSQPSSKKLPEFRHASRMATISA